MTQQLPSFQTSAPPEPTYVQPARIMAPSPKVENHSPSDTPADQTGPYPPMRLNEQLREDLHTFDGNWSDPGFMAVALHRLGDRAQRSSSPFKKKIGLKAYGAGALAVDWVFGIKIPLAVRLGRRVRIWHHGCIVLDACSIGDDVNIRHNTTIGPRTTSRVATQETSSRPIIESRADLGSGVCVLGPVRIGAGAMVGANTVVLKDVPEKATVLGVPARVMPT